MARQNDTTKSRGLLRTILVGDEGAAVVEFALAVPLLALMIMAGTGVAMIIHAQFAIQAAAREAATVGAYVSTSIDPYDTATEAARESAEKVMVDYKLDPQRAAVSFGNTSPFLERGTLFEVHIVYSLELPLNIARMLGRSEGEGGNFYVTAMSVLPIQKYKARWPCPSNDPICD